MTEENQMELNRRNFLAAAAAVTCGCAFGCPAALADDDDDAAEDVPKAPAEKIDVGPVSDFARDGSYDKWIKDKQIIVFREEGKIYAVSALCTHKQALLRIQNNQIYCPRHKSVFNFEGKPVPKPSGLIGQAKKPLPRYAISVNADKHLIVDTHKSFDASKADDPSASVKV